MAKKDNKVWWIIGIIVILVIVVGGGFSIFSGNKNSCTSNSLYLEVY